jgi:hypothetical protein
LRDGRPIRTTPSVVEGDWPMLAFQLIGAALLALFFGAMVTGQHPGQR